MTVVEEKAGQVIGTPMVRREDPALLTGEAKYTNDLAHPRRAAPGPAAQPLRPRPHHQRRRERRRWSSPGVVAAYTGADLQDLWAAPMPCAWPVTADMKNPAHYPVAVSKACYVGDAVAVVLATSEAGAHGRASAPSTSSTSRSTR